MLYDVSHDTCKVEQHVVEGELRSLHLHRKGATRAYEPVESVVDAAERAGLAGKVARLEPLICIKG